VEATEIHATYLDVYLSENIDFDLGKKMIKIRRW
jgi:hypothetical protein